MNIQLTIQYLYQNLYFLFLFLPLQKSHRRFSCLLYFSLSTSSTADELIHFFSNNIWADSIIILQAYKSVSFAIDKARHAFIFSWINSFSTPWNDICIRLDADHALQRLSLSSNICFAKMSLLFEDPIHPIAIITFPRIELLIVSVSAVITGISLPQNSVRKSLCFSF